MLASRTTQHLNLALSVLPLLRILRGEKRAHLQRAFICSALDLGTSAMRIDEGRLPINPKEAALELHRAVLDLCLRAGLSRRDLTEDYNDHGEAGTYANGGVGEASERALALLAIFHARTLTEPSG